MASLVEREKTQPPTRQQEIRNGLEAVGFLESKASQVAQVLDEFLDLFSKDPQFPPKVEIAESGELVIGFYQHLYIRGQPVEKIRIIFFENGWAVDKIVDRYVAYIKSESPLETCAIEGHPLKRLVLTNARGSRVIIEKRKTATTLGAEI